MNKGIFTTIKLHPTPMFLKDHYERLKLGVKTLGYNVPVSYLEFEANILKIKQNANLNQALKVIIVNEKISYELRQDSHVEKEYKVHVENLYQNYSSLVNFGEIKHKNYPNDEQINYIKQIKAKQFNDVILIDEKGNVLETLIANVFYVKSNKIYTTKLNNNVLNGIIRQKIIKYFDVTLIENISVDELLNSDCVFVTNCLLLVQQVTMINDKKLKVGYDLEKIRKLIKENS